ncbi:MAG: hypothetical protein ACYC61_14755 [Isosphaeraceae bacterium]
MNRPAELRRIAPWGCALAALAFFSIGADDTRQTVDARGLTFEAPKAWKSSTPANQMRRAQLQADPIEGDAYPAELIVFAFPGGAGSVEDNLKRWQNLFKDDEGNSPQIETKKVKAKNTEVTRAEIHGDYHPASFGGPAQPVRKGARLLGAIVTAEGTSFYIRMVGPDRTMKKLAPEFDELLKSIKVGE